MLTNAYLLAKIGADTAENEQHFAEILLLRHGPDEVLELEPLPRGEGVAVGRVRLVGQVHAARVVLGLSLGFRG